MDIIAVLSQELSVPKTQIESAVKLMDEGNTIPFIARYRKEVTGGPALFSTGGTGAGSLRRQAVPQIQDGGGQNLKIYSHFLRRPTCSLRYQGAAGLDGV